MTIENWAGAVCMQFGVYFTLCALWLRERSLRIQIASTVAVIAKHADELCDYSAQLREESARTLVQRDKLAELARRWVPNDDNGHGGINSFIPGAAPTHIVDRILRE